MESKKKENTSKDNSLLNSAEKSVNDEESILDPIDEIIAKLLDVKDKPKGTRAELKLAEINMLIQKCKEIFKSQPVFLEIESPVNIMGDIHGQYFDLLRLFDFGGYPPKCNYLCLGDFVDRGKQSIETLCLLMAFKVKFPENFFLIRGNHESELLNRLYGFYDECSRRFTVKLWKSFTEMFNWMPIAALIDDKIFCVHGGLSPDLSSLEILHTIKRPTDVPNSGLLCDLLWSDPSPDVIDWGASERGVSYVYSPKVVKEFLEKNGLDLICRAHQVVEEGYEFFGDRSLVTVFSAPDYCSEYTNDGSLMIVDENLKCSFKVIRSLDNVEGINPLPPAGEDKDLNVEEKEDKKEKQ